MQFAESSVSKIGSSKWLGEISYPDSCWIQRESYDLVERSGKAILLGLEHPATITLGRSSDARTDILVKTSELDKRGVSLYLTDRGGRATLHSPGQLVIYPIVPIRNWGFSTKEFVDLLMKVTANTLEKYGVKDLVLDETDAGLHTNKGKIAFCGLRIEKGISRHGISVNVSNDTELFHLIRPCGVRGMKMDRLADHQSHETTKSIFRTWYREFESVFNLTEEPISERTNPIQTRP